MINDTYSSKWGGIYQDDKSPVLAHLHVTAQRQNVVDVCSSGSENILRVFYGDVVWNEKLHPFTPSAHLSFYSHNPCG